MLQRKNINDLDIIDDGQHRYKVAKLISCFTFTCFRSSHQRCSIKKSVFRDFAKFTRKYLCQSLYLNKVTGLRPATLLKRRLWNRCFPVNFAKFLRKPFFIEHLWWLLLRFETFSSMFGDHVPK